MVDKTGQLQLFNQLCDVCLQDLPKAYLRQPRLDKAAKKKRLRQVVFNAVFQCLQGPHK